AEEREHHGSNNAERSERVAVPERDQEFARYLTRVIDVVDLVGNAGTEGGEKQQVERVAEDIECAAQPVRAGGIQYIHGDVPVGIGGGRDAPTGGNALHELAHDEPVRDVAVEDVAQCGFGKCQRRNNAEQVSRRLFDDGNEPVHRDNLFTWREPAGPRDPTGNLSCPYSNKAPSFFSSALSSLRTVSGSWPAFFTAAAHWS